MSDTLHRMKVIIEANNAKLKQAMREATSVVNNTVSQMNTSTSKIETPGSAASAELSGAMKNVKKSLNELQAPEDALNTDSSVKAIKNMQDAVQQSQPVFQNDDLRQSAKETEDIVRSTAADINNSMNETQEPVRQTMSENMQMIQNMQNLIKSSWKDMVNGTIWKQATGQIRDYVREAQVASGIRVYNPEYEQLCNTIAKTEMEQEKLIQKMNSMDASKRFVPTQEFKDLEANIAKTESAYAKLEEKQKALEAAGKATVPSADYSEVKAHYDYAQARLEKLIAKQREWLDLGFKPGDGGAMTGLTEQIKEVETEMKYLKGEMKDLEDNGKAMIPTDQYRENTNQLSIMRNKLKEYKDLRSSMLLDGSNLQESEQYQRDGVALSDLTNRLREYNAERRSMENSGTDIQTPHLADGSVFATMGATAQAAFEDMTASIRKARAAAVSAIQNIPVVGQVASSAAYIGSRAFKAMSAVLKGVGPVIKTASGAFGALLKKFTTGLPGIRKFAGGIKQGNNALSGGIGKLLKYGLGIRSMYALFSKLRNALVDGFKNLAKKNSETNANLSELSGGLQQLKNSLATAFSPILNTITPALSTLINYLVQACNVVGQFFAALTGQKTYTTASKVQKDYAASLDKTGDSAANAADKVKKSLMGFDEINKLDDDSKSSSGGSSGSDGGSFEENEVTNKYANFAQMIKDAWANADFTEIGKIAGQKLNAALENIPWDDIKKTCNKVAKSVATFLNGFMEGTDWRLVGKTIAEGINTAVGTASTFVTNFDWSKLGKSVGETIDSTIKNIDWSMLGKTASDTMKGLLTSFCEAVQNVDWKNLGESVKTAILAIDWKGILQKAAEAAGSIAGGAAAFVAGLLGDIPGEIYNYFMEKKDECGGSLVKGIFKGITDALENVGNWIKENILDPFVDGFKKAFGIHSPSTVFADLGKQCIAGLLQGIADIPGNIAEIAKKIWSGIKDAWDNLGDKVLGIGTKVLSTGKDLWDSVQGAWDKVKNNSIVANVSATLKGGWDKLDAALDKVKNQAKNTTYTFKAKAVGAWNKLKAYGRTVVDKIKSKSADYTANARGAWDRIKNYLGEFGRNIKNRAADYTARASGDWSGIARNARTLYDSVKSKTATFRANAVGAWDKVSGVLGQAKDWLVNKVVNWKISIPHFALPHLKFSTSPYKFLGKTFQIPKLDVEWYASGGFPKTGEMFMANEAGPELVGKMGNKTTVANQQQIIAGIEQGVYKAVMAAFSMQSAKNGKSQNETPTFNIYVGGRKVTDVVVEEINHRTKSTGVCPILV